MAPKSRSLHFDTFLPMHRLLYLHVVCWMVVFVLRFFCYPKAAASTHPDFYPSSTSTPPRCLFVCCVCSVLFTLTLQDPRTPTSTSSSTSTSPRCLFVCFCFVLLTQRCRIHAPRLLSLNRLLRLHVVCLFVGLCFCFCFVTPSAAGPSSFSPFSFPVPDVCFVVSMCVCAHPVS